MKKIAIDCRKIAEDAGISSYIISILNSILDYNYDSAEFILIINDGLEKIFDFSTYKLKNISIKKIKSKPFSFWENIEIPFFLLKNNVNLYHATHFNVPILMPLFFKCRVITTIHDIIPYKNSVFFKNIFKKLYFKFMFPLAAKISYKILTVSEYSKKEIVDYLDIPPNKIKVIYNITNLKTSKNNVSNDNIYRILFVGSLYEHKNVISLIKALKILVDRGINNINLDLAGKKTPYYYNFLEKEINSLNLNQYINVFGVISQKELEELYEKADLFVFPSLAEGFGIPLIEAMHYSLPIISSNKSVMPEIVGDAGILTEPTPENLAEKMEEIRNSADLAKELVAKGLQRKELFTIDAFKTEINKIYHSLGSNNMLSSDSKSE